MEVIGDYEDVYYDEEDVEEQGTWEAAGELYTYCVGPVLSQALPQLIVLIACCFLYRVTCNALKTPDTCHILSSALGLYVLHLYFRWGVLHVAALVLVGYIILLVLCKANRQRGPLTGSLLIIYLVLCDKVLVAKETWSAVRGAQMIVAMKIASLAFDMDAGRTGIVDVREYAGYVLCPGSAVWGPWIPFPEYRARQRSRGEEEEGYSWATVGFSSLLLAFFYLLASSCFIEWFLPENRGPWWSAYKDALSFRTGHYFVCWVSRATTAFAGYEDRDVCSVTEVEMPRSLSRVVVHWNLPTHKFLKTYVFGTTMKRLGAAAAVMATYMVSSFLHGLDARLAAVLLSLGLYTYVETSLRMKLSTLFDSCVGAKACPTPCTRHSHTPSSNLLVHFFNIALSLVAVFHLAYLGALVDTDPMSTNTIDTFQRWRSLDYLSHYVVLATFSVDLILSLFVHPPAITQTIADPNPPTS